MGFLSGLFGGGGKGGRVDVAKRWDLRNRTGQGSMSKVWSAYDKKLGRMVCLKLLDREKTQKFEEKFKLMGIKNKPNEGQLTEELNAGTGHPNIVKTLEHGVTTAGEPYIVMEWIDGLGLNALIETRSAQLNGHRISFLKQLADALTFLHKLGFLHRDLCPRNVMVTREGVVKLIDFGLTIPYKPEFCQPGNRTGTADYLAPEIIKRMKTDHRVDIFALGVTAYEVCTGQLPWERSLSSEETLRRHLNTQPRSPKELNPELDDDLSAILTKCIERDFNDRYRDARAFRNALDEVERQDF